MREATVLIAFSPHAANRPHSGVIRQKACAPKMTELRSRKSGVPLRASGRHVSTYHIFLLTRIGHDI
jgi:hypothetical protein